MNTRILYNNTSVLPLPYCFHIGEKLSISSCFFVACSSVGVGVVAALTGDLSICTTRRKHSRIATKTPGLRWAANGASPDRPIVIEWVLVVVLKFYRYRQTPTISHFSDFAGFGFAQIKTITGESTHLLLKILDFLTCRCYIHTATIHELRRDMLM